MTQRCVCGHPWGDHAVSCYSTGCPCNFLPVPLLAERDALLAVADAEHGINRGPSHGYQSTTRSPETCDICDLIDRALEGDRADMTKPDAYLAPQRHPFTCGLCGWGRDGEYHSEDEYRTHLWAVHPASMARDDR